VSAAASDHIRVTFQVADYPANYIHFWTATANAAWAAADSIPSPHAAASNQSMKLVSSLKAL
jgi:hypothetical protein